MKSHSGETNIRLRNLFSDRLEFIDGKYTNEFYFYCTARESSGLVVGDVNRVYWNHHHYDFFVTGIEWRPGRSLHLPCYRNDDRLFFYEGRLKMWTEWMGREPEGVLVSGEIWGGGDEIESGPFKLIR